MFLDESGFLPVPSVRATWAPRGRTPHLVVSGHWTKISAISALSVSPRRKRVALYLRFHPNENIRGKQVALFRGPLVLLWDRSRTHRGRVVESVLRSHPRIHAYPFPGYALELNPNEFVWTHLKRDLANSLPRDLVHLRRLLEKPVRRLRRSQQLLWSCIWASDLPW